MGLLSFDAPYDRTRILQAAARAQARRQRRRAIRLYRRVIALETGNAELHTRIAPLLAEVGQDFDAWISYRIAGRTYLKEGRPESALATYRDAVRCMPRCVEVWLAIAKLHRHEGRSHEAVDSLLEGYRYFRGRKLRPQAIHLLQALREIEPRHLLGTLELARTLARASREAESSALLHDLSRHLRSPEELERLRFTQWRLHSSLGNTVRWLRARYERHFPSEPERPRLPALRPYRR
ncbi:MAG: hypothetical protein GY725_08360 [bacterium]|nr:hypothetical protein [bacterium]